MNLPISNDIKEHVVLSRIISASLHQIDVDSKESKAIKISHENQDLEAYLNDLLEEIKVKELKREYEFNRETTEFYTSLTAYYSKQNLPENSTSNNLAERLLEKEITTDNRYGHLGHEGKGHVKKGSFLQFLYREGAFISYLGVKIEHQVFLDEDDFKRKIGLSIANKIYKACKVNFNNDGIPNKVFVYDTNKKPSLYWWSEFLELKETRNNAHNTRTASTEVIKVLNRIKKDHQSDYTILRNSVIGSFKQKGEMKYDEFLETIFTNYDPVDKELKQKLPTIITRLKELPEKKKFDTSFQLEPSEVPFNKKSYPLTKEITLSITDGIDDIEDKVWSELTADGKKLVVVNSPDGFEKFVKKERV